MSMAKQDTQTKKEEMRERAAMEKHEAAASKAEMPLTVREKLRKYRFPILMLLIFETVAVTLWITTGNSF